MFVPRHQIARQNTNIKIIHKTFHNVAEYKYLIKTAINQNSIHEGTRSRLPESSVRLSANTSEISGSHDGEYEGSVVLVPVCTAQQPPNIHKQYTKPQFCLL
jgi:hypothetical protein